jgi:transposase
LAQVPGIGAVTATAFVAVIDEVERFGTAKQVRSYLGLVPQENSSGEKQHRGRISKTGNSRIRQLLVEVSWGILCVQKRKETEGLRRWATRIAERRGRRIATVALARKLAGILYAMWRDGTEFDGRLTNQLQPLAIA